MPLPPDVLLTSIEARRIAAQTATRLGIPFDRRLVETIDDVIADVFLDSVLGPKRPEVDHG
jgi:hypothetical protein